MGRYFSSRRLGLRDLLELSAALPRVFESLAQLPQSMFRCGAEGRRLDEHDVDLLRAKVVVRSSGISLHLFEVAEERELLPVQPVELAVHVGERQERSGRCGSTIIDNRLAAKRPRRMERRVHWAQSEQESFLLEIWKQRCQGASGAPMSLSADSMLKPRAV